jgi:hypothetical protein
MRPIEQACSLRVAEGNWLGCSTNSLMFFRSYCQTLRLSGALRSIQAVLLFFFLESTFYSAICLHEQRHARSPHEPVATKMIWVAGWGTVYLKGVDEGECLMGLGLARAI